MKASEIMTRDVVTAREDDLIREVAHLLLEKNISGVPVVDADGKIIGIISEGDLVFQQKKLTPPIFFGVFDSFLQIGSAEFQAEIKKIAAHTVGELMTKKGLVTAGPDAEIEDLAELMTRRGINRIPIVDREGRPIGIVTRNDIVRAVWKD